mmetsp:Transcript_78625/g.225213  ORF Transcript_78625/g.225213 Transcript_78625/m.225213 type:complete len:208 (+) Transcript_78625:96-719(+)
MVHGGQGQREECDSLGARSSEEGNHWRAIGNHWRAIGRSRNEKRDPVTEVRHDGGANITWNPVRPREARREVRGREAGEGRSQEARRCGSETKSSCRGPTIQKMHPLPPRHLPRQCDQVPPLSLRVPTSGEGHAESCTERRHAGPADEKRLRAKRCPGRAAALQRGRGGRPPASAPEIRRCRGRPRLGSHYGDTLRCVIVAGGQVRG